MLAAMATAFGFGLRHGADWDHLAAITDITSSTDGRRRSLALAFLYAAGHAVVVLGLGIVAIAAGDRLPSGIDAAMGRVVGLTLLGLGLYVFWSLARDGRQVRLRSRWMLVFEGLRRLRRRMTIEHEHDHAEGHHGGVVHPVAPPAATSAFKTKVRTHSHAHRHVGEVPVDPFPAYGGRVAFGIGALHGVGAETPTQVLLFVAAAGVAGPGAGIAMLLAFVVGLVVTNTAIAVAATYGFLHAGRHPKAYLAVAVVTGVASVGLGLLFLLGQDDVLPAFFAG